MYSEPGIRSCASMIRSRVRLILLPGKVRLIRAATSSTFAPSLIFTRIYVHLFRPASASCIAASDILMRAPEGGEKTPTILYCFAENLDLIAEFDVCLLCICRSSRMTSSFAVARASCDDLHLVHRGERLPFDAVDLLNSPALVCVRRDVANDRNGRFDAFDLAVSCSA